MSYKMNFSVELSGVADSGTTVEGTPLTPEQLRQNLQGILDRALSEGLVTGDSAGSLSTCTPVVEVSVEQSDLVTFAYAFEADGDMVTVLTLQVVVNDPSTTTPKQVFARFKEGVQRWVQKTSDGLDCYLNSSRDLNIGDIANIWPEKSLESALAEDGLTIVSLKSPDFAMTLPHYRHLVDDEQIADSGDEVQYRLPGQPAQVVTIKHFAMPCSDIVAADGSEHVVSTRDLLGIG